MSDIFKNDLKSQQSLSIISDDSIEDDSVMFELGEDEISDGFVEDFTNELQINSKDVSKVEKNPCPVGLSFKDFLRNDEMVEISSKIFKKVIKSGNGEIIDLERQEVSYQYAMFIEGKEDSIASSSLTGEQDRVNVPKGIEPHPGCFLALSTMKKGEEALFWISEKLMFGKLGCPPRIPPFADILFKAKVKNVTPVSDAGQMKKKNTFNDFRKSALESMKIAESHFQTHDYNRAIDVYRKWIGKLQNFNLKDEQEETKLNLILVKMMQNCCICYNKVGKPEKTCILMRDLERLTSITNNVKALYAKGVAKMMLNDLKGARKCLRSAEIIMPDNIKIANTISELNKREEKILKHQEEQEKIIQKMERELSQKKMEMKQKAEDKLQEQAKMEQHLKEFKSKLEKYIEEFKNNKSVMKTILLQDIECMEEVQIAEDLCKEYQISLLGKELMNGENSIFYLSKESNELKQD